MTLPSGFRFHPAGPGGIDARIAEQVVEQIRGAKSASETHIHMWLSYNDERITCALFESRIAQGRTRMSREIVLRGVTHALSLAGKEGFVWTAALDRFSTFVLGEDVELSRTMLAQHMTTSVAPALQRLKRTEELASILESSHSARLITMAVRIAPARLWDAPTLEIALSRMPRLVREMTDVRRFDRSLYPIILEHMVRAAEREDVEPLGPLDNQYSSFHRVPPFPKDVFEALYQAGLRLSPEHVARLVRVRKRGAKMTQGGRDPKDVEENGYLPDVPREMLGAHLQATANEADSITFVRGCGASQAVEHLFWPRSTRVAGAALTPSICRAILETFPRSRNILECLAHEPMARRDPEIRPHLLRARSASVASGLIEDIEDAGFASLFRILAAKDPHRAAEVLETRRETALPSLVRADLAPLLGASEADVRLRAITIATSLPLERPQVTKERRGSRR